MNLAEISDVHMPWIVGVIRKGLDTLDRERCPSFSPSLQ
jgi:hypothetical protein